MVECDRYPWKTTQKCSLHEFALNIFSINSLHDMGLYAMAWHSLFWILNPISYLRVSDPNSLYRKFYIN